MQILKKSDRVVNDFSLRKYNLFMGRPQPALLFFGGCMNRIKKKLQKYTAMFFSELPMGEDKYYLYVDVSNTDISAADLDIAMQKIAHDFCTMFPAKSFTNRNAYNIMAK